jgi:hypothetical protein
MKKFDNIIFFNFFTIFGHRIRNKEKCWIRIRIINQCEPHKPDLEAAHKEGELLDGSKKLKIKDLQLQFFTIFDHQHPGFGSGSAIRKNAGSGSAF